jgi:predicted metal-dependent phosphoesterase TrpH
MATSANNTPALQHSIAPSRSFVDLHLHTHYSDGQWSPSELLREAARQNFAAIAITDHDTLDGIPEALRAGAEFAVEVIPGVEITCAINTEELHMLGYFLDQRWKNSELHAALRHAAAARQQRIEQFITRLNHLGIPLSLADVRACSDRGTIGRPHIAMALVRRGFVHSIEEAFARFLTPGSPAFVDRPRPGAAETIALIKRAGGIAVLAHPGLGRAEQHLPQLLAHRPDGLEVWHPRHTPAQTRRYLQMTHELGLLATGGSDCHGPGPNGPLLGIVKVPIAHLEALRQRAHTPTR